MLASLSTADLWLGEDWLRYPDPKTNSKSTCLVRPGPKRKFIFQTIHFRGRECSALWSKRLPTSNDKRFSPSMAHLQKWKWFFCWFLHPRWFRISSIRSLPYSSCLHRWMKCYWVHRASNHDELQGKDRQSYHESQELHAYPITSEPWNSNMVTCFYFMIWRFPPKKKIWDRRKKKNVFLSLDPFPPKKKSQKSTTTLGKLYFSPRHKSANLGPLKSPIPPGNFGRVFGSRDPRDGKL